MMVSFDPGHGLIVLSARLWGPAGDTIVRLALDTVATRSLVNWDILVLLGYDPAAKEGRIQVTTGSSVEFAPLVHVERIETLGHARERFPFLAHTLPPSATVDGLLGLDFLRGYRLGIDFISGTVTLEP